MKLEIVVGSWQSASCVRGFSWTSTLPIPDSKTLGYLSMLSTVTAWYWGPQRLQVIKYTGCSENKLILLGSKRSVLSFLLVRPNGTHSLRCVDCDLGYTLSRVRFSITLTQTSFYWHGLCRCSNTPSLPLFLHVPPSLFSHFWPKKPQPVIWAKMNAFEHG